MDGDQLVKNLKIVAIMALIIGVLGAVLYLIYGFTIIWQAMAAGIITGFLSLIVILFVVLSIYLWIKNLLLKKDLKHAKVELNKYKIELEKYKAELEKSKVELEKKSQIK
jgi:hypothetical protein